MLPDIQAPRFTDCLLLEATFCSPEVTLDVRSDLPPLSRTHSGARYVLGHFPMTRRPAHQLLLAYCICALSKSACFRFPLTFVSSLPAFRLPAEHELLSP